MLLVYVFNYNSFILLIFSLVMLWIYDVFDYYFMRIIVKIDNLDNGFSEERIRYFCSFFSWMKLKMYVLKRIENK